MCLAHAIEWMSPTLFMWWHPVVKHRLQMWCWKRHKHPLYCRVAHVCNKASVGVQLTFLFSFLFSLSSHCQNMGVSYHLFCISNLVLILLITTCFVFFNLILIEFFFFNIILSFSLIWFSCQTWYSFFWFLCPFTN